MYRRRLQAWSERHDRALELMLPAVIVVTWYAALVLGAMWGVSHG
ncbi:MAG: hypothetical protein ACYCYO_02180 [Bacilli bacterium]